MSVLTRVLHLFEPVESRGLRLPIDFFFHSLADDINELAVDVILSGMGSDCILGLRTIKEKNGIVMVQDPNDAKSTAYRVVSSNQYWLISFIFTGIR